MATKFKNLPDYDPEQFPSAGIIKCGIVVSEWNSEITGALYAGALETLIKYGVGRKNIKLCYVPGSFELASGADLIIRQENLDVVICLGCIIQGETRHFEFLCQAVSQGLIRVSLDHHLPVIFGVLTTDTLEQARARSGGDHGNKGVEAALTAIKMADLRQRLTAASKL